MAKTILIVEDNELNMKLFDSLLESNGYITKPISIPTFLKTVAEHLL